jgi:iron complex transport system substrate-binding protein
MRIVSLLPSATEIVFALGLGDELVGRTHECDYPADAARVPVMTADATRSAGATSSRINELVDTTLRRGDSIYRLDLDALARADPDVVLTQKLCEVCAVAYDEVADGLREIGSDAALVNLEPSSIEGIFNTISTVGAMTAAEDEAIGLLELLRERLGAIENRVLERRLAGIRPPRVVCLEWLDPPFAAGHWVPEQVRRAGGWELLGQSGERSVETSWEAVRDVDPDLMLLMPCGFDVSRTAHEWEIAHKPAWINEISAVSDGEVYALDGSAYFSRPGPRVVDGIAILAELFDPDGLANAAPADAWLAVPTP